MNVKVKNLILKKVEVLTMKIKDRVEKLRKLMKENQNGCLHNS